MFYLTSTIYPIENITIKLYTPNKDKCYVQIGLVKDVEY
jgi:hypothetical protein